MSEVPKPKHCNQNWDNMLPTNGGRMCGQCDKLIVDFRKIKWKEIENIQTQNNNTVCGLYSNKQLNHWGKQPPIIETNLTKPFYITSFLISLFTINPKPSYSQVKQDTNKIVRQNYTSSFYVAESKITNQIFIQGKMFDAQTKEAIPFANVWIDGTKKITTTDFQGNFILDITDVANSLKKYIIKGSYVSYKPIEIKIKHKIKETTTINLPLENGGGTMFAVEEPKKKRFSKIKGWFKKK